MNRQWRRIRTGTILGFGALLVSLPPSLAEAQIRLRRNFGKKEQFSCASNPQRCASTSISRARSHLPQIYRHDRNLGRQVESQLNRLQSDLNRLNNLAGPGSGFRTIDPFGDYLFHGVSIRPKDGNLVTRHLDPAGFAARAEEWAQELGRISRELDTRQGQERQKFISELSGKLELAGLGAQHQLQLSDLSGGRELKSETLGEELTIAGLPVLEGDTPALLRDPFGDSTARPDMDPQFPPPGDRSTDPVRVPGRPIVPADQLASLDPSDARALLAGMSDEQRRSLEISAGEKEAQLTAAIDKLKEKEFAAQLGASSPPDFRDLPEVAKDWLMDAVPFARTMEDLGKRAAQDLAQVGSGSRSKMDQLRQGVDDFVRVTSDVQATEEWAARGVSLGDGTFLRHLGELSESANRNELLIRLGWGDARTSEGWRMARLSMYFDVAQALKEWDKGNHLKAVEHTGKAASNILPSPGDMAKIAGWVNEKTRSDLINPSGSAAAMSKAHLALTLGSLALDLGHSGIDMRLHNHALRSEQERNRVLAWDLAARRADLEGKLNDTRQIQRLITGQASRR